MDSVVTETSMETDSLLTEEESETEFTEKEKEEDSETEIANIKKLSSFTGRVVVWNDLNVEQSQALIDAPTLNDVRDILAEIFNLTNYVEDLQEEILLHLYVYTVQYARDKEFSTKQLSAYFSIVKNVHEFCVENTFVRIDKTFDYFEEVLIRHCFLRPPYNMELFSISEARKIAYHLVDTYFRHFKLYKYAFTPQVMLDLVLSYVGESDSAVTQATGVSLEEGKSEIQGSEEEILSPEKQLELLRNSEKEKAKAYLRNMITEFLQGKIKEIKLSVQGKLKDSEKIVNTKLDEAGYSRYLKKGRPRLGKSGRTN
ncbi:cilia- and flagella-associated protein 119 isoform X2 [Octopus bimaculoides]|uniref:cilia- and flagella-associated protein 119 isoform X2 n=1 Tax=Octopus bimaculoides TaxID=37653 RepID=UPI0022DFD453|nr:cilia- and flagella-associated protein 119 isoform X2 [Octopus bimaculoides]